MATFIDTKRDNFRLGLPKRKIVSPAIAPKLPIKPKIDQAKRMSRARSFKAVQPRARVAKEARTLKSERKEKEGIKVEFGPSTLKKLLEVDIPLTRKVPDPGDPTKLIDEEVKDSAGNVILQKKVLNIGDLSKKFGDQIKTLNELLSANQLRTDQGFTQLGIVIGSIDASAFARMTITELRNIRDSLLASGSGDILSDDPLIAIPNLVDGRFITGDWIQNRNNLRNYAVWVLDNPLDPSNIDQQAISADGQDFINNQELMDNLASGQVLDFGEEAQRMMFLNIGEARDAAGLPPEGLETKVEKVEIEDDPSVAFEEVTVTEPEPEPEPESIFRGQPVPEGLELIELSSESIGDLDDAITFFGTDTSERLLENIRNRDNVDLTTQDLNILEGIKKSFE